MEYQCPKCKTVVTSSQKLLYCICGGKYSTGFLDDLLDMCGDMPDGFRKDNLENIINKAKEIQDETIGRA